MAGTKFCPFTSRQMEVLQMLADGLNAKKMERELGISHRTIEVHRRNLIFLLGAQNSTHAVAIALRTGLIK